MKTKTYHRIEEVHAKFRDAENVLVQIFTVQMDATEISEIIRRVRTTLPQAKVIGMTVDLAIDKGRLLMDKTLFVVTLFGQSRVRTKLVTHPQDLSREAKTSVSELLACEAVPAKAVILMANAFSFDANQLAGAVADAAPELTVAGGLASDHRTFSQTCVFTGEGISSDGFALAMLYGETLHVSSHYDLNWRGLGKKFKVTSARGNRLFTLDGKPVLEIYRRYLGSEVHDRLPAIGLEFPLIFQEGTVPVARAVMQMHEDGSLTFAGGIEEGTEVQFGFADIENMLEGPDRYSGLFSSQSVESIFVYSCIARYTLLGKEIEAETLQMQHIAPTAGAFTYGEFFHDSQEKNNRLLNQTMTALALSEGGMPRLEPKNARCRNSAEATYARTLSHFIHEMTSDLEQAYEAEKHSKEMMAHQSRQATMGEIIEMIAHQWRQPLNIVALSLQDIYIKGQLGALDKEVLEKLYSKANASIQYLSQTIDDFRDFMKPDVAPEPFAPERLFKEIERLISGLLKKNHVTLTIDLEGEEEIVSRKNELMQVVLNLITNAVEAMRERNQRGGKIDIVCRTAPDKCILSVCDNAGGIEPEIMERVFEPYFTTKGEQNGTGLGLYIASQIVEKNLNGTLTVCNKNNGVCFTMTLPVH